MTNVELLKEFATRKGFTNERRKAFAEGADALGRIAALEAQLAEAPNDTEQYIGRRIQEPK